MLRVSGDRYEAEEVVQETFLRAWRNIGRFQGCSQFFTWLYRIGVNEARRPEERRRTRPQSTPLADAVSQVPDERLAAFKSRLHRARLVVRTAVEDFVSQGDDA